MLQIFKPTSPSRRHLVLLKNKNLQPDQLAKDFIQKAVEDKNELLQSEAKLVASKYNLQK